MLGDMGECTLVDAGLKPGKKVSLGEAGKNPAEIGERITGEVMTSMGVSGSK
jgi:hypothetical protein